LKIAFIAGDDLTQNARLRRQARTLAQAGHRVTVYGVLSPATEPEEDAEGVVYVRVPLKGWKARGGGLRGPMRIARWYERFRPVAEAAASRERPDAVHADDLDVALPAQDVARTLRVPFVMDAVGAAYVDRLEATLAQEARRRRGAARVAAVVHLRRAGNALEKRLRRRGVAAVIADTQSLADDLARRYGGPRPVVVRSCPPLSTPTKGDGLRAKIRARASDRLLLFSGPLDAGCGIDAAIRALKLLGRRHLLVVTGRVPRLERFERLAEAAGVAGQLRFVAPAPPDETARLVASADVALVPTEPTTPVDRLGIPQRLFTALAAGLPVVASDTKEVGAIVRRTGAGVLYPARSPQDPAALAEGVHTLLDDAALLATCAESAARAAREEFNWERESLRLVDLYDEIEKLR
jgi:glycosyltransferase involved in cell wall biosynthesis